MRKFTTPRILTLTVAVVLLAANFAQIAASARGFDSLDLVKEFLGSTAIDASFETMDSTNNPDAPFSNEDWDGNGTNNSWTTNDNWTGLGGAGAGDVLTFPQTANRKTNDNDFPVNTGFDKLVFNGTNYVITGNQIVLAQGIVSSPTGAGSATHFHPNILLSSGQTFQSNSGVYVLDGVVNLNGHTLTVGGAGNHTFAGQITNTGAGTQIDKAGSGNVFLDGNGNNVQWQVSDGSLVVRGSSGTIGLLGGTLRGDGTVASITGAVNGGTISPGESGSAAILNSTGTVSLASGMGFEVDLNGPIGGYDKLTVGGTININNTDLIVHIGAGFSPASGEQFTIMQSVGAGSITGNFAQGSSINVNGQVFAITYNLQSVVLTALSSLTWDGGAGTNNWSNAANWTPDFAPLDTLDLVFPAGAPPDSLNSTNDIAGLAVGSITISGGGYTIGGNAITLSDDIVAIQPAGSATVFSMRIDLLNDTIVNVGASNTLTMTNVIGGVTSGLSKTGSGTLIMNATNAYSGATSINGGKLLINGDSHSSSVTFSNGTFGGSGIVAGINAAGTVAPGAGAGNLTANNSVVLQPASTLNIEIGGTTAGVDHDRLVVVGNTTLNGGNLTGALINGYDPAPGTQFTILQSIGQITGQFAQGNRVILSGRPFSMTYDQHTIVLIALPTVSGSVSYGNAAAPPKFISNATVTAAGSPNVATTTGAPGANAGQYSLTGFGAGSYTVSLTKTTGQNGIGSNDAARIAQHVAGTLLLTTDNQRVSADASGNGAISSNDAAKIAQFVAGLPFSPPNLTGTWRFFTGSGPTFPVGASPTSRTYSSFPNHITGDDYTGLLIGEVTGNWAPGPLRPAADPSRRTTVTAPRLVTTTDKEIVIPVTVGDAAEKGIISYEFDLRYDPSVIQPEKEPTEQSGTISSGLSVVVNPNEPGLLRVVVYGAMPIDSNGVLLNLRFRAIGAPGSVSPLTWERLVFNEGDPQAVATDGQVELSAAESDKAEIRGKLLTAFGTAVPNTSVTLTDTNGQSRSSISNAFGVYRFAGLQFGESYLISVESRRYAFAPLTVSVISQMNTQDMIAE